jgi:hypothetical protein
MGCPRCKGYCRPRPPAETYAPKPEIARYAL